MPSNGGSHHERGRKRGGGGDSAPSDEGAVVFGALGGQAVAEEYVGVTGGFDSKETRTTKGAR
jgi:hypothetical protein